MFFLWVAAMMLACWSVEVARMFARRMGKEAARRQEPAAAESPQAAVILPIKGVDAETERNVRALLQQDYPRYRLLFAVESAEDPVVPLLERIRLEWGHGEEAEVEEAMQIVVAGIATERGQKIHNQLAAVAQTTEADELLVFMDADARPRPYWLRELVKPLKEEGVGASTGFRFYVPAGGGRPSFPNIMVSVINAAVAALLGPGWRNIAWGGSMAVRRGDFFRFGVADAWQHALSDDYVLSWCVKNRAGKRIEFVQACLVPSAAEFTWKGFWEFAVRQYRITKVCAPGVWLAAVGAAVLHLAALAYTLIFWLGSLRAGSPDHPLLVMFLALYIAHMLRGYWLLAGGMSGLPSDAQRLKRAWPWYTVGYPVSIAMNLLALGGSAIGREIHWRGVRYRMRSRLETDVIRETEGKARHRRPAGGSGGPRAVEQLEARAD
jgi:hypothetical protein